MGKIEEVYENSTNLRAQAETEIFYSIGETDKKEKKKQEIKSFKNNILIIKKKKLLLTL